MVSVVLAGVNGARSGPSLKIAHSIKRDIDGYHPMLLIFELIGESCKSCGWVVCLVWCVCVLLVFVFIIKIVDEGLVVG